MKLLTLFLSLCCFFGISAAWDSIQLEVFDVVEEVKENLYTLLNVSQDATPQQIKSAYRILTLKLHPDKNKEVDTSEQFRNLVSAYEVLRNAEKRKYYDEVLVNGLPNWRSAVYYYRYVRKMGMTEVCVILFFILTIGQYLVNWASYYEKMYTLQEQNKKKKGKKYDKDRSESAVILPKPSIFDTLPIQIPKLLWFLISSIPQALGFLKQTIAEQIEEAKKPPPVEEPPEPPKVKTVRKRNKGFVLPEGPNFETTTTSTCNDSSSSNQPPPMTGGLWTDDDLEELIKLVKKYPGGSSGRWEVIAEALGRTVPEVTYMAHKVKQNGYRLPSEREEEALVVKVKQKTKKDVDPSEEVKKWSQGQQKALEDALAKYSKGHLDRWDKIAESVPGKTKEDCMQRFKYIADNLKKQKEAAELSTKSENI